MLLLRPFGKIFFVISLIVNINAIKSDHNDEKNQTTDSSEVMPKIGAFDKQCGKLEPNEVEEVYMMPQGYKCPEELSGSSSLPSTLTKTPKPTGGTRLAGNRSLRLNGGWSAGRSFRSFVVVNFEGKDGKGTNVSWRCNGAFIDESIILTSTSCSERQSIKVSRVRVSVDNKEPVSVKRFCKLENLEKKPGDKGRADGEFKNDLTLLTLYQPIGTAACLDLNRKPKRSAICAIVAEGQRSRNGTSTTSPEKWRSIFVSRDCPSSIVETKLNAGETCYSRSSRENLTKFNGNLCSMDTGAPVYCVDHCQFGSSKLYLAGIVSNIIPETGRSASCEDGDQNSKFSFVTTDLAETREKLLKMIDKCGSKK